MYHISATDGLPARAHHGGVPNYVQQWRLFHGWTLERLGGAIGMTKSGVQKLEAREDVSTRRLAQIATALGHEDPAELLRPPPDSAQPAPVPTTALSVPRLQACIEAAESLIAAHRAAPTIEQKALFIALLYDHVTANPGSPAAEHRKWAENVVQLFR